MPVLSMLDADVSLLHSGLSVSRSYGDSAVSKAPTREYAAVAPVEGDYTYFVMIVWSFPRCPGLGWTTTGQPARSAFAVSRA